MKRKSDVNEKMKHFIQWVHTQRGIFPKNILSDGGEEYITLDLRKHCEALGINLMHTEAYSPQMNGIAERINRTIEEERQRFSYKLAFLEVFGKKQLLTLYFSKIT